MSSNYTAEDSARFLKRANIVIFIGVALFILWYAYAYGTKIAVATTGNRHGLIGKLLGVPDEKPAKPAVQPQK